MAVRFLLGASGSGKSRQIYEDIIHAAMKEPERDFFLIVPEQYTMEAQRELVTLHPAGGMMNIDAIGMNRLAYRVFDELGLETGQVLEDFGKSMLIKKILCEKKDELSVYGGYYDKLGFVDEMKSMMSEIFQYNIRKDQLDDAEAMLPADSAAAKKIQDIRCAYEAFEDFCGDGYVVAEQLVELLAMHAEESGILNGCSLYFDGFTGFTPVQFALLKKLMLCAKNMTFSFTIDDRDLRMGAVKEYELFYLTKTTIKKLVEAAGETGVSVEAPVVLDGTKNYRFRTNMELAALERNLFRRCTSKWNKKPETVHLTETHDVRSEALFVASQIRRLVRDEHYRYRDFAIVTGDLEQAAHIYEQIMKEYDIPVFIDTTACLKGNPCAETIRSILAALADDFSYESVFRFLKAGMTDFTSDDIETLEQYAWKRNLRGYRRWARQVPESYEKTSPVCVEDIRARFVAMISPIRDKFKQAKKQTGAYVEALYDFLTELRVYEKLEQRADALCGQGRIDEGDAAGQIFEKTVALFDKIYELLGETCMSIKEFAEIVDTGLSSIEVGVVPPTVDRVVIGDITRSRLGQIKVLFFTAVNDGIVPKSPKKGRILNDRDRELLEQCGLILAPSEKQNGYIEQFYIYTILTKPSDQLFLSYRKLSASLERMRPSYLIRRLVNLFPKLETDVFLPEQEPPDTIQRVLSRLTDPALSAGQEALCLRLLEEKCCSRELEAIRRGKGYRNTADALSPELVTLLYGKELHASVSRLETYARCGFAYFLRYGLRLKERETYQVDVRNVGVMLHQVMEDLFKQVRDTRRNDWTQIEDAEREQLVTELVARAAADHAFEFFEDSARNAYMLQMIERMAQTSARMLQKQVLLGTMKPYMLEKTFDTEKDGIPEYVFELPNGMRMSIVGKIDRVDLEEDLGTVYMKVLDYKSSAKKLSLTEILHGEQLQLVTYAAIAYELERAAFPEKHVEIAGLLYYSFDDPIIELSDAAITERGGKCGFADESEIFAAQMEKMKPQGFINGESSVLSRMDRTVGTALPVKRKKDGTIKEDEQILTGRQLENLISLTREHTEAIGTRIAEGDIRIAPYKEKGRTGCDFCDYRRICHFDVKNGGNHYRIPDDEKLRRYKEDER